VAGMTIQCALDIFLEDYCWMRGYSKSTCDNYQLAVRSLIKSVGNLELNELTYDHIKKWKRDLDKSHENNGVASYMYKTRLFLRYTIKKQGLKLDLDDMVIPKREHKLPRYLKVHEIQQVIDSVPEKRFEWIQRRDKAVIALLFSSGIRLSELCRIRFRDVSGSEITIKGKGHKERIAFIDERAMKYITEYLDACPIKSEYLFIGLRGSPLNKSCITHLMQEASNNSGMIRSFSAHTMRHSFATSLLNEGCNLRYIQELLGHADISTTQIYTSVATDDLRRVYKQFHRA
jgi:site-specific recombinase XerD